MKYLIGIGVGIVLSIAGVATARVVTVTDVLTATDRLSVVYGYRLVTKIYDSNNGASCYTFTGGATGYAISCIK